MVVERGIALRYALQLVVEVYHYLAQRYVEMQLHAVAAHVFLVYQFAALVKTQLHYRPYVVGVRYYRGAYVRLLDVVYQCLVGQS